jgi:hypothetical protein
MAFLMTLPLCEVTVAGMAAAVASVTGLFE